jgi:protein-L-isoaspartate(D-aspartate) O-methyltransferase
VSVALAENLAGRGIRDGRVLEVMAELPREAFVPEPLQREAEADRPLPIGHGQTISQPLVVAFMTERLALEGTERVLEIGTGSGYQAAVLAKLAREVHSIEIIPELSARAAAALAAQGICNVHLRVGDGRDGWPEAAPFDRILVTAATPFVPPALLAQLRPGGRLILPIGEAPDVQQLRLLVKRADGTTVETDLLPVRFVPLTVGVPAGDRRDPGPGT